MDWSLRLPVGFAVGIAISVVFALACAQDQGEKGCEDRGLGKREDCHAEQNDSERGQGPPTPGEKATQDGQDPEAATQDQKETV